MAIWDDFMARHPVFALNVMQMMGQRIEEAHARLKEMSTQDVEHRVAHAVRRLSSENLAQTLAHIHVARAFTCYQMAALLAGAPAGHAPTLVLDFLDTFYDESAAYAERRWLLEACVEHLRRLSHTAAVVVSIRPPPPPQEDPTGLLQIVQRAADQVWFHPETRPASQPRLFE
jgi:hypothetical protein